MFHRDTSRGHNVRLCCSHGQPGARRTHKWNEWSFRRCEQLGYGVLTHSHTIDQQPFDAMVKFHCNGQVVAPDGSHSFNVLPLVCPINDIESVALVTTSFNQPFLAIS